MKGKRERRFTGDCELRAVEPAGEGRRKIAGHAAVFDSLSEDLWGFRERIVPGAFREAIGRSDIRALLNHDPNFVLGRTANGTLRVHEDDHGLAVEIDPPATGWADDLLVSIGRGDISQMSFAFRVGEDRWDDVAGTRERTILSFDEIFDVSPVTYPAYPDTDLSLRTALDSSLLPEDAELIRELIGTLRSLHNPREPGADGRDHPGDQSLSILKLKRRLRLLELENSL